MMNRELETRYKQMRLAWNNLVDANVELVDENKMLKEEIERLNNIINEIDKWLDVNLFNLEKENANNTYDKGLKQGMLTNGRLIKNKLQELKGSE